MTTNQSVGTQLHHDTHRACVLSRAALPRSPTSRRFEGGLHGDIGVSLYWLETPPGEGPALHQHPYAEVFVVQSGEASFNVDGVDHQVSGGQLVIVPPHCPHRFVNCGATPLQLIAIHASARMEQTWLEASGQRCLGIQGSDAVNWNQPADRCKTSNGY